MRRTKQFAAELAAKRRERDVDEYLNRRVFFLVRHRGSIPHETFAEWTMRINAPDSLSSFLLGDPKPGCPRWKSNKSVSREISVG